MNDAMLNTAIRAARNAGNLINRYVDRVDTLKVRNKQPHDFVTEVDRLAEQEIIGTLSKAYPGHAFLGEEGGFQNHTEARQPTWIIDPLDGTTNFLHGFPQFAVSIALRHKDQLQVGVIYDPSRNELFTATRGGGARLNNRRIRVNTDSKFENSLIATGFPYYQYDDLERYLNILRTVITKTAGIRRPGSAALDLAYTAASRFDGFWEFNLKPWDIAAGTLIIQEAGGIVSDFDNGHSYFESGNILCAPPKIHRELLHIIQGIK